MTESQVRQALMEGLKIAREVADLWAEGQNRRYAVKHVDKAEKTLKVKLHLIDESTVGSKKGEDTNAEDRE